MRIGIDGRMFSSKFTGIGRYTFELVKNLLELGTDHTFVLFLNPSEYSNCPLSSPQLELVPVHARHYSLAEQTSFLQSLNKAHLDLMHFTHFNAPILYTKPSVVTIHDLTLSFFPGKKMTKWVHRKGYELTLSSIVNKAHHIIAVSKNTKKDLLTLFPKVDKKTTVIYEATNPSFKVLTDEQLFSDIKKSYSLEKPFLLYTGVWRDHKNVVGLIEAFAQLRKEYGIDCDLVITGKEDPFYPEVKETVAKHTLVDSVRFVGLVPEDHLIGLYNLAHVYVFPSFYEGFGLPPLEAFACETPVACSNASCLPEICGEGNAAFFDPNSIDEMAKTIHQVFTDDSLRATLIANGRRRLQDFSWKDMAEETLAIYESTPAS